MFFENFTSYDIDFLICIFVFNNITNFRSQDGAANFLIDVRVMKRNYTVFLSIILVLLCKNFKSYAH